MERDEFILNGLGAAIANKGKELGISAENVAKLGVSNDVLKLLNYFPALPPKVQDGIKNGTAFVYGTELFSIIKPSANANVITHDSQVVAPGITNVNNSTLGKAEFFLATGIKLLYNASTASTVAGINNQTEKFDALLPNDIFTSVLELKKSDKDIIVRTPVAAMHSPVYGYGTDKQLGYMPLPNPKFFEENQSFSAKLEKMLTFTGTAGTGYTYFAICGIMVKG